MKHIDVPSVIFGVICALADTIEKGKCSEIINPMTTDYISEEVNFTDKNNKEYKIKLWFEESNFSEDDYSSCWNAVINDEIHTVDPMTPESLWEFCNINFKEVA